MRLSSFFTGKFGYNYYPQNKRFVLGFVLAIIIIFVMLMTRTSQKLDCYPDQGCTVTKYDNFFDKTGHIEYKFSPQNIASYKILSHTRSSGGRYSRRTYYVYSLYLEMKDGSGINLKDITRRNKDRLPQIINDMWYNKEVHE